MRISTPLATALTFATAITVTLETSSDQPGTAGRSSVVQHATVTDRAGYGYAFFPPNRISKVAVSWDRDIPVTYLIAKRKARPRMFATITEAFRRARVQTGIRFRYGGRTGTAEPIGTADRPVVLVDFGTAHGHPRLAKYHGGYYAVGGPYLMTEGGSRVFTGGQITIDVETTKGIGQGFRHGRLGATLLHEVGHVLGLDHVNAPRQMMAPGSIRADIPGWFQDGDLRGLRRLIHG